MAEDQADDDSEWIPKFQIDEELEFFTDLAFQETERWLQAVTKKKLSHADDLRCSLQNGVLLCELVNCLKPGSVPRINRLNTPIAGLDNLNLFLKACQLKFGLREPQLFDPLDLEDLSRRAAFSDDDPVFLKQESDRKLRHVVLTVYWLGQVARNIYHGPQLDQSAFSGLVAQNPGVLSPEQSPQRGGWQNSLSGSPYSVASRNSDRSRNISGFLDEHAISEASYGSYDPGSDGAQSINGELLEQVEMSHHGSASNLNRWGHSSPVYSNHDSKSSMYRSSPNLSHSSHNRSSSNDSLDGGGHGLHSRQSSGSNESYPTRRLSSSGRPSVNANPLQFVKLPGSSHLAETAQQQIKIAEETKKIKWDTLVEAPEDTDWQSKLGNWKSKRRTRSAASYERKEEEESVEKDQEEKAMRSTKTFKEMVQERDRRKSMNSYPLEDENDEYTANNQSNDINHNRTESARSVQSSGSLEDSNVFDSAPWAASSDDDTYKRDSRVGNGVPSESDTESNKENYTRRDDSHNNNNNLYNNNNKTSISEKMSQQNINTESKKPRSNKLNNILQAFEEQAESDIDFKSQVKSSKQKFSSSKEVEAISEEAKLSPRSPRTDKDFVEKSITISQKPNSEKGFGFTFSGGRDLSQPIVVERVSLGGAADVCEVRIKDEIIEMNRRKVATYSHTQVEELIKRAVRTGKLELKIKRYIRKGAYLSDEFSEEDSFDRFEEQMEKQQAMRPNSTSESVASTPMMDSLLRENNDKRPEERSAWSPDSPEEHTAWSPDKQTDEQTHQQNGALSDSQEEITPQMEHTSRTNEKEDFTEESNDEDSPAQIAEREAAVSPVNQRAQSPISPQVSPQLPVLDRRQTSPLTVAPSFKHSYTPYSPDSDYKPASVITAEPGQPISIDFSMPNNPDVSGTENSGFGPPKALLRWQRRPQSQYGEQEDQTDSVKSTNHRPVSMDISQATNKRGLSDGVDEVKQSSPLSVDINFETNEKPSITHVDKSAPQITPMPVEQEEEIRPSFVARPRVDVRQQMKKMEEWDQRQEKRRQPDEEKTSDNNTEQKDFEKNVQAINDRWQIDQKIALQKEQKKIMKDEIILAGERKRMAEMEERKAERKAQRQAQLAQLAQQEQEANSQSQLNQRATNQQSQSVQHVNRSHPQEMSEVRIQLPGQGRYNLQIDPANRPDVTHGTKDSLQEVNFRVNLNQQTAYPSPDVRKQNEIDEERQRLLLEEKAMRKRIEEEKIAEEKRLREREEQLKRHEERLRQEEERLRLEQERLQKERQEHLHGYHDQRVVSPASLSKLSPSYPSSSASSLSPPFNSQPEADQQFSSTVVIANSAPDNYYVKSVQHAPVYQSPFVSSASKKREDKSSERLTREDLMAMSRSARPLEDKPPSVSSEPSDESPSPAGPTSKKSPYQPTAVVREAPTKQEKHTLNAVPKPRLLDSSGWMNKQETHEITKTPATQKQAAPRPAARRSDIMKKQYSSPQDHWLVQEAERRRLEEQSATRPGNRQAQYRNGPIKPHETLSTNRWRDSGSSKPKPNLRASTSFEQMRQKFTEQPDNSHTIRPTNPALQPRAAPRQMSGSSLSPRGDNYPSSRLSPNSAHSNNRNSWKGSEAIKTSPTPAPRSRPNPPAPGNSPEPTMAVSGRQRCSHCKEELGYGAAMVIESLNLHYHMQCFRCCVCHTQLGNGVGGADVRVRGRKLHCPNCHSNDEAGLKFSKV